MILRGRLASLTSNRAALGPLIAAAAVTVWLGYHVTAVRDYGWDDGAITEAYARTFSQTGRIALTPSSPVGEGFSSPAWFLVLSVLGLVGRLFGGLGFMGFIRAGQWLAVLFAAVGAGTMTVLLRRWLATPAAVLTAVLAFSGAGMVNEAMNGMEMLALCAVAVGLALALHQNTPTGRRWAIALAFAMPLVRLEGLVYLALFGVFVFWWRRRAVIAMGLAAALSLAVLTGARLLIFHAWLPNTIAAKRLAPYSGFGPGGPPDAVNPVLGELLLAWGPIAALLVGGCLVMTLALIVRAVRRAGGAAIDLPMWPLGALGWALGCTLVNWKLGLNWGYLTRMELSMIPLGIAAAAALFGAAIRSLPMPRPHDRARTGRHSAAVAAAASLVVPIILAAVVVAQFSTIVMKPDNLTPAREHSDAWLITPHAYRTTASEVDRVRVMLGQPTLRYLVPDVGGSSLCCEQLTILDSALLTNPELTRLGWAQFDRYLRESSPDVIETHGIWSMVSQIYTASYFTENYRPIVIGNRFLYLRSDLLSRLGTQCRPMTIDQTSGAWYRGSPPDEQYLAERHFDVCGLG